MKPRLAVVLLLAAACGAGAAETPSATDGLNIVVIVTDDQRADEIDAMPYLSSRPAGEWVSFTEAVTTTPLCCPARASILTGRYSSATGVVDNGTAGELDTSTTFVHWLDEAGYRTGLFGKYLNNWWRIDGETAVPDGWDRFAAFLAEGGTYLDYRMNVDGAVRSFGNEADQYSTDVIAAMATEFLRDDDAAPFLLYVAPSAPHDPSTPAPRHQDAAVTVPPPSPAFDEPDVSDKALPIRERARLTATQVAAQQPRQVESRRSLLAVDELIEGVVTTLQATGDLDHTMILVTSDHGVAYGEHRIRAKGCAYEGCIRVPLLVRYPGANPRDDDHLVANIDLAPTIAEAAGVAAPDDLDGRSLVPLVIGGSSDWRGEVMIEHHPRTTDAQPAFSAILTDRWKYIAYEGGGRELYDLDADPDELSSLHEDPALDAVEADLASRLADLEAG